jgi:hypothetical protein
MPDLKLYYIAIVIKTAWHWYKDRQVDQRNRVEDPEMNPRKGAKTIQWGEEKKPSMFNKWCWLNWWLSCRRMRIDPFLSPGTKLKSKWIKELHIKPETLKLIKEKMRKIHKDHRGKIPEQNSNCLCCKIKNRQIGPHKTPKLLQGKGHCQ